MVSKNSRLIASFFVQRYLCYNMTYCLVPKYVAKLFACNRCYKLFALPSKSTPISIYLSCPRHKKVLRGQNNAIIVWLDIPLLFARLSRRYPASRGPFDRPRKVDFSRTIEGNSARRVSRRILSLDKLYPCK